MYLPFCGWSLNSTSADSSASLARLVDTFASGSADNWLLLEASLSGDLLVSVKQIRAETKFINKSKLK